MHALTATVADAAIFVGLAWALWRLLRRSIPIAVVPIVIGLALAGSGWLPRGWGVPSAGGEQLGWLGVLLLAFAAGMETRLAGDGHDAAAALRPRAAPPLRLYASAAVALLLPFVAGALAAYHVLLDLPQWMPPNGDRLLGSLGLGLCIAVSALPVLIGIVREQGPSQRPFGRLALRIAVLDDAALWIGLALLLLVAGGAAPAWSRWQWLALAVLLLLLGGVALAQRRDAHPPRWLLWCLLPAYLGGGAWASSQLGLHGLLGAYFAGAMLPAGWTRRLPVEGIGRFALLGLAPLFFGHSGLRIDADALGWASLQTALALLALSVLAKLAAVMACPPLRGHSRRETLAVGALLQCKGLMEIVAATILRDKGLLSGHAFAALVVLAVLSTLLTGPLFRLLLCQREQAQPAHGAAAGGPR